MEITYPDGRLYGKDVRDGVEIVAVERVMDPDDEFGPRFGSVVGFTFRNEDIPAEPPRGEIAEDDPGLLAYLAAKRRVQDQLLALAMPVIRELAGGDDYDWTFSETAMCKCGCSDGFVSAQRLTVQGRLVDFIVSRAA